ncbi:MAG: GNAT family N-acetyltransferase [Chloroflexi bacterium]|nr:GNAT family N-acetyltransferase [Chloroflexota bacterium]
MTRPELGFLQGATLLLRPKLPEDAERDYAWRTDEELARLDAAEPYRGTFEDFRASYLDELAYPSPDSCRFAMVDAATGKHIGNCMYYDLDRWGKDAELGILIGEKQSWSKGYGEEAVRLLLDHLFGDLSLQRVHLQTLDWNVRAQRCFEKCGFTFCGQSRRGRLVLLLMEIPRSRWLEDRKRREGDGRGGLGKPEVAQADTPRVP